jgi:hypothetical protein
MPRKSLDESPEDTLAARMAPAWHPALRPGGRPDAPATGAPPVAVPVHLCMGAAAAPAVHAMHTAKPPAGAWEPMQRHVGGNFIQVTAHNHIHGM